MTRDLQRILHVDDESSIQAVAKMALESVGGYTVETCASGQEAIDKAPAFAPDLILLDAMMPGMDGPETLQELRRLPETGETPVVFMTAKVQDHEIESFKDLGAVNVITKPFNPMTLSDQVREIWNSLDDK